MKLPTLYFSKEWQVGKAGRRERGERNSSDLQTSEISLPGQDSWELL